MKPWTDMPKGVPEDKPQEGKPTFTKPRRNQYAPGSDGESLFRGDIASWEAGNGQTPSPGFRKGSPQKDATRKLMAKKGNFS